MNLEEGFLMKLSQSAKNAFMLGSLCSISYFAVYIARNILGAVTPKIIESGAFDEKMIGSMSAVYFATYAIGQLINGLIGDKIKAKYMITAGLILAGLTNFLFPYMTFSLTAASAVYGVTGFSLAMIYAPMTKIVSESTEPIHAVRCSFGYTIASFFGTPAAGIFATYLAWQPAFTVTSVILVFMGAVAFIFFTVFERRGVVKYGRYERVKETGSIKALVEHSIIRFSMISIITGIIRTSVIFWLATYIAQYLNYGSEVATGIYTAATFVISLMSIIAIVIYELLGRRRDFTIIVMFIASIVFFLLTYLVYVPVLNIIFIVIAIMASNGAAAILWSVYCPSLRDTGRVSSATGFLDFLSYIAAAVANVLFANAVEEIGWGNLILVWCVIVTVGLIFAIPYKQLKRKIN